MTGGPTFVVNEMPPHANERWSPINLDLGR
jgi:hypothetical protein